MTALFPWGPPETQRFMVVELIDGYGMVVHRCAALAECQRCKAWVADTDGHTAWHRSVDTDQTADLAQPWRNMIEQTRATMVPTDTQGTRHDDSTRHRIPDPPEPPHDS